jgi:allantoicase
VVADGLSGKHSSHLQICLFFLLRTFTLSIAYKMEIQAIAPEVIQDTVNSTVTPVAADKIDSSFKSDSTGRDHAPETTLTINIANTTSQSDLINKALGSRILSFSDEWFAAAENLTTPTAPIRKPGVFTYAGAWYDGWETRRHNPEPFDWVVIRLGVASGRVKGVEVDTAFFNGNQAPEVAVQGCFVSDDREEEVKSPIFNEWETILEKQEAWR